MVDLPTKEAINQDTDENLVNTAQDLALWLIQDTAAVKANKKKLERCLSSKSLGCASMEGAASLKPAPAPTKSAMKMKKTKSVFGHEDAPTKAAPAPQKVHIICKVNKANIECIKEFFHPTQPGLHSSLVWLSSSEPTSLPKARLPKARERVQHHFAFSVISRKFCTRRSRCCKRFSFYPQIVAFETVKEDGEGEHACRRLSQSSFLTR